MKLSTASIIAKAAKWGAGFISAVLLLAFVPATAQTAPENQKTSENRYIGFVDGSPIPHAPQVDSPVFGRSMSRPPNILRMFIGEPISGANAPDLSSSFDPFAGVERKVKDIFFANHGSFVFNVVAAVGESSLFYPGVYGDPSNPWFNVFLGYYQIDVKKSEWGRPFGYESADQVHSHVHVDDLLRLGKADWNYFSNWLYGVPEHAILPYNDLKPPSFYKPQVNITNVGSKSFHAVSLSNVTVVSAYESDTPGADKLVKNTDFWFFWHEAFGLPGGKKGFDTSFIPTTMKAKFYMAYFESEEYYHTVMFGGVANQERKDADILLDVELGALRDVITSHYYNLGWN